MDQLPHEPLVEELLVEPCVEGDGEVVLALQGVALSLPELHEQLLGGELDLLSFHRYRDALSGGGAGSYLGRRLRERGPDARHEPPVLRPDDPEVRLEVVGDYVLHRPEGELLDVQLVEDDVREALHAALEVGRGVVGHGFVDHYHLAQGLAGLYGGGVAGRPAEAHDAPRIAHPRREVLVDERLLVLGPVGEVDALGSLSIHVHDEVLVDRLRQERREGGGELGHRYQALVQGGVGGLFVGVVLALPEAPPAPPHVPVRELVDEIPDRPPGRRDVVGVEPLGDRPDRELQLAEGPAVHEAPLLRGHVVLSGVEAVDAGVGDEEGVGVPEGEQVLAHRLVHLLLGEAARVAGARRCVERPPEGVGALLPEELPGVYDVA